MSVSEIKRCTYCGEPISARAAQIEHVFRERNSLSATNDSCAKCNRLLETWDIAGQLPPGPYDALGCLTRRLIMLAQNVGDSETSDAAQRFELGLLQSNNWEAIDRGNDGNERRKGNWKRFSSASSGHQDYLTAVMDNANREIQFCDYMMEILCNSSSDNAPNLIGAFKVLRKHAQEVSKHPALFIQWWESEDHRTVITLLNSALKVFTEYGGQLPPGQMFRTLFDSAISEAGSFLIWLRDKRDSPRLVETS